MSSRRVVFSTFGSFGDLHPYLALALEMGRRGHSVTVATSGVYQSKIEAAGLEFAPVRPDIPDPHVRPDEAAPMIRNLMDRDNGTERLFRELLMPSLRDSYDDLLRACQNADLLVTHQLPLSGPIVADVLKPRGLKWASAVLAPLSIFSAYDPSVPPIPVPAPLAKLAKLPPRLLKPLVETGKRSVLGWVDGVFALRRELGLAAGEHPMFEGQHSPALTLALFSRVLAQPQRDWPASAKQVGYCFYDKKDESAPDPRLRAFLEAGAPPIVFTLGSTAVFDAGDFFASSLQAAQTLKRRALLLVGRETQTPPDLTGEAFATNYAPFSEVFPRACAVVHQGGAGTTGQVLRAGVPSLVMPYAHDQPDHAKRLERLGVARQLPRESYNADSAARELQILLGDEGYSRRARELGAQVQTENGPRDGCDALEALLS